MIFVLLRPKTKSTQNGKNISQFKPIDQILRSSKAHSGTGFLSLWESNGLAISPTLPIVVSKPIVVWVK